MLVLAVVALAAAAAFVVAAGALGASQILGELSLAARIDALLAGIGWPARAGIALASLCVGVAALSLLLRRAFARSSTLHMLASDDRGFVGIDSKGIVAVAEHAAITTRGVLEASAQVKGDGTSPVRVRVDLSLYPGADLKRAGAEAKEAVRRALEEMVGIGIRELLVAVHVLEPDALGQLLR